MSALNTANYIGFNDWRRCRWQGSANWFNGSSATEQACRNNELGYMYYYNLTPSGDTPPTNIGTNLQGNQTIGDVMFTGIQQFYWSGTEYTTSTANAWNFGFDTGLQGNNGKLCTNYGWAVRPGNVPGPAAVWLFGSGLLGLIGVARWQRS